MRSNKMTFYLLVSIFVSTVPLSQIHASGSKNIRSKSLNAKKKKRRRNVRNPDIFTLKAGYDTVGPFVDAGLGLGTQFQLGFMGGHSNFGTDEEIERDTRTRYGLYMSGYLNDRQKSSFYGRIDVGQYSEHFIQKGESAIGTFDTNSEIVYTYGSVGLGYQFYLTKNLYLDILGSSVVFRNFEKNYYNSEEYFDNGRTEETTREAKSEEDIDIFGQLGIGIRI